MSDYQRIIEYLYGLQKHGIKFGLNRTENLMARLDHPEQRLRCIHIGGTNGKGSTASMLSAMLQEHGFKVGLYTSPHLVRFTERFMINGKEATPDRIVEAFEELEKVLDPRETPTFFEVVTALAFVYFAKQNLDWVIVEVGMGGRLDATNIIRPLVSIITNVSLEHQEFLGTTLSSIAREKAGIIKEDVPVVTAARQPAVQSILKTTCLRGRAPLYRLGAHFRVRRNSDHSFQYHGRVLHELRLRTGLRGEHQAFNASLALCALEILHDRGELILDPEAVRSGLKNSKWAGRLEILEKDPLVILDGAHNPQGAGSLRIALQNNFSYEKLHLILAIMGDKDIRGIFRRLLPLAETVIFTRPAYGRAADPEALKRLARPYGNKVYVINNPATAIEQAKSLANPEDLVCIAGSLYFAGEVKQLYGEAAHFQETALYG